MSWSEGFFARGAMALVAVALPLSLAACGFTPVYATSNQVAARQHDIFIETIPDRSGQYLRNALIDRLNNKGQPASPRYSLRTSRIVERSTKMGVRKDATATRAQMELAVVIRLYDGNALVLTRQLEVLGGYNLLNDEYATLVSEQAVRDNLLNELAARIETELSLYFLRAP